MGASRFCEHCDVALDLHPSGHATDDPPECEAAEQRANLIADFWNVGSRGT